MVCAEHLFSIIFAYICLYLFNCLIIRCLYMINNLVLKLMLQIQWMYMKIGIL